jgi:superfamily II DNA/RNA helicase
MGIKKAEIGQMTGEQTVKERDETLRSFRTSKTLNVLFISDVAGEGINLVVESVKMIMIFIVGVSVTRVSAN